MSDLEALLAGALGRRARRVLVGVDDEQHAVAGDEVLAVVDRRASVGASAGAALEAASAAVAGRLRAAGSSTTGAVVGACTSVVVRRPRPAAARASAGSSSVNALPSPGVDVTSIVPPSRLAISREIDRPRPVPP